MLNDNNPATPANNNTNAAPLWRLYFELAEDYMYKQEIGPVPPKAVEWLEDYWEVLPLAPSHVTGELQGTPEGVFLYETLEVTRKSDDPGDDHVSVVQTHVYPPERVEL